MPDNPVIAASKNLIQGPEDVASNVVDKVKGAAQDVSDAVSSAATKAAGYFMEPPSTSSVDQQYAARQVGNKDAADGRALMQAHPDLYQQFLKETGQAPAAADGSTPSTGEYHGTDILGNPVTLSSAQRAEATSGAVTGLDEPFAQAHPNIATVHNLLPLIGLATGVTKLASNLAGVEGASAIAAKAPIDIEGRATSSPNLPNTAEHFQALMDHADATPELKTAIKGLQPAIRDPETGNIYLADDPKATTHADVFADLPKEVADKSKLDTGFVGPDQEYMTRQQAADSLISAQATGTPRPVTPEVMVGPPGASGTAKNVGAAEGATTGAADEGAEGTAQLPEEHATPAASAQTLAEKQLANLKAVRVGQSVAEEFGRPDIATTVPESLTMEESQSLKQNLESYYAQGTEPPKMAAHVQALASTYQEENEGIHALNLDLRARAANGEDVSADLEQLKNRFSAMAENYSTLAGTRSDVGKSLQILSPNKPGNAFVAATSRLAQEFSIEDNPERLSDMLASLKPEQFARVGGQMAQDVSTGRSLYNALNEYYVNNLLSNAGRTSSRIGTSNAISALLTIPRSAIESVLPGSPTQLGEPLARIQGMVNGFWHATDVGLTALKTGERESQIEGGSIVGTPFADAAKAISGQAFGLDGTGIGTGIDYLGNILRLPSRGLTAVHQFGHSVATSMETHSLAWRQAVSQAAGEGVSGLAGYQRAQDIYHQTLQDVPSAMRLQASKAADVTTFANQLEGMSADAQKLLQYPVLKQLMPFFKVAYNVKKMGADITPGLGLLTQAPDLLYGDASARSAAVAKQAFGAVMGLMVAHEFHQGNIVLDKYGSPKFKFGDNLVSVPEPLAFPIASVGNYMQNRDSMDDPTAIQKAGAASRALGSAMANDSIVQGLVNIKKLWADIESGDPKALEKFAGEEASGLVPWSSLLRGISQGTDPLTRNPQTMGQEIQTGVPGESEQVQPKYDIFAKPVPNPIMGLPQRLLYPVNITKTDKDPVTNEMSRLRINAAYPPTFLNDQQSKKWIDDRADGLRDDLESYIKDKDYPNDADEMKKAQINHIVAIHTHIANVGMLDDPKLAAAIEAHKDAVKGIPDDLLTPGTANEFGVSGPAQTAIPQIQ